MRPHSSQGSISTLFRAARSLTALPLISAGPKFSVPGTPNVLASRLPCRYLVQASPQILRAGREGVLQVLGVDPDPPPAAMVPVFGDPVIQAQPGLEVRAETA